MLTEKETFEGSEIGRGHPRFFLKSSFLSQKRHEVDAD